MSNKKIILVLVLVTIVLTYFLIDFYMFSIKQKDMLSGMDIIKTFEKNQIRFISIKDFTEKEEGFLNASKTVRTDNIIIENNGVEYLIKDEKVNEDLLFILEKLNFTSIYEESSYIEFRKDEGKHPRGVIYLKNNTVLPRFVLNSKEIHDGWYYYATDNV